MNRGQHKKGVYDWRKAKGTAATVRRSLEVPEKRCALCLARLGLGGKLISKLVPVLGAKTCMAVRKRNGLGRAVIRNQEATRILGFAVANRASTPNSQKVAAAQRRAWRLEWRSVHGHKLADHWSRHPEVVRWMVRRATADRAKRKTNYHLSKLLRSRIYTVLKGQKKSAPTEKLLGCSWEQCREYIQAKFKRGMTWENHGKWHIDHIIPCASFDLSDPKQQAICFHYSNLQPMWAKRNRVKQTKIEDAQMSLPIGFVPIRSTAHTNRGLGGYSKDSFWVAPATAGLMAGVQNA